MLSGKQIVIISLLIGLILASIFIPLSLTGFFDSTSTSLNTLEDEDTREPVLEYIEQENGVRVASLIFDNVKKKWRQSNGMVFVVKDHLNNDNILNDETIMINFPTDSRVKKRVKVNGVIHEIESISQIPLSITLSVLKIVLS